MTILKVDTKRKGMVTLYLDNDEVVDVSRDVFSTFNVCEGSGVTVTQIRKMASLTERERAKNTAISFLSIRSYSLGDIKRKLRKGFNNDAVLETCKWLEEKGYINDEKYAREYADFLIRERAYAGNRIFIELRNKCITSALAQKIVDELPEDVIKANLLKLIIDKSEEIFKSSAKRVRMIRGLQRYGYKDSDIIEALEEAEKLYNDKNVE